MARGVRKIAYGSRVDVGDGPDIVFVIAMGFERGLVCPGYPRRASSREDDHGVLFVLHVCTLYPVYFFCGIRIFDVLGGILVAFQFQLL